MGALRGWHIDELTGWLMDALRWWHNLGQTLCLGGFLQSPGGAALCWARPGCAFSRGTQPTALCPAGGNCLQKGVGRQICHAEWGRSHQHQQEDKRQHYPSTHSRLVAFPSRVTQPGYGYGHPCSLLSPLHSSHPDHGLGRLPTAPVAPRFVAHGGHPSSVTACRALQRGVHWVRIRFACAITLVWYVERLRMHK